MSRIPKAILCWSSGKDSAWTLHVLRQRQEVEVVGLLTTINEVHDRVAMHAVRVTLLQAQAEAVGLPLWTVPIPSPCSNQQYEMAMETAIQRALADGVSVMAFGDLFLEDVRRYRETQLAGTGLSPLFPIWGLSTTLLRARWSRRASGHVSPAWTRNRFPRPSWDASSMTRCWRIFPRAADPCGERGEFHTFAYAGPMFRHSVPIQTGEIVTRDGFVFADLR